MTFTEFVLFVQEMFFAVFHLNSVSQATQTTGIVASILLTTPSNVIFFPALTYLSLQLQFLTAESVGCSSLGMFSFLQMHFST